MDEAEGLGELVEAVDDAMSSLTDEWWRPLQPVVLAELAERERWYPSSSLGAGSGWTYCTGTAVKRPGPVDPANQRDAQRRCWRLLDAVPGRSTAAADDVWIVAGLDAHLDVVRLPERVVTGVTAEPWPGSTNVAAPCPVPIGARVRGR